MLFACYRFSRLSALSSGSGHIKPRYLRAPVPVHFPTEQEMPESAVHFRVRTALFLILERALRGRAFVGSDQFVYWDPTSPQACLSPDVFVRLGGPFTLPKSFKVWEHGAPQFAIEVMSDSDASPADTAEKLERYRRCGVAEVVRFDPEGQRQPLRYWDLVEGDLVERDLATPEGRFSPTLGAFLCVLPHPDFGQMLRIAEDPQGESLWLTPEEWADHERAERERERATAEARVAELEAELARRR